MHTLSPPRLETFSHWPSWLNARGHVDRSACFELKVSEVRRLAGCVPMGHTKKGKPMRLRGRALHGVADLPNERAAPGTGNAAGRLSAGWWEIDAWTMQWVLDGRQPRGLAGDWRTARAPAMRPTMQHPPPAPLSREGGFASGPARMMLEQGGYGPGQYAYERREDDFIEYGADAGLDGNPNRGACREKRFGLGDDWRQRLGLEKWRHNSVSGVQYFLICPGPGDEHDGGAASRPGLSTVGTKGLKGLTGTTSNCGDGSRGAHGKGWVCGQRVYKLFWVLAREDEHRDAAMAERWIAGLTSGQLAQRSAAVSALVERYGPIMGERLLRCRRCLRLRYGQSPEVLRKKRRG